MARVSDTTTLARTVTDRAVKWYADNGVPKAFRNVDPVILKEVIRLNGGDWRRCITDGDGSVIVCRNVQWTK